MQRKTKQLLQKWLKRLLLALFTVLVIVININRFYDNTYSNYEKAVDYGRVREDVLETEPTIAAIFHTDDLDKQKYIYSYLNHNENYKKHSVKIVLVPQKITDDGHKIIEKLYEEIFKHNPQITEAVLVYDKTDNVINHEDILRKNINKNYISLLQFDSNNIENFENEMAKYLQKESAVTIILTELNDYMHNENTLTQEAIFLGQKYSYKLQVFDIIDTQLASKLNLNYADIFPNYTQRTESVLQRQKRNLQTYLDHYKESLLFYFKQNINVADEDKLVWPKKNQANFRLFDRGAVYVRFYADKQEIFSRAKLGTNKGIVISLIEIANKAAKKEMYPQSADIYLLTDMEILDDINNLENDDGVYIQYKNHKALMAFDELNSDKNKILPELKQKAQIPSDAKEKDIKIYKFKTVEINYAN